jgi:hypothetical protein
MSKTLWHTIKLEVPKSDAKENGVHPIGKT